jgi:hypothetical protein
MCFICNIREIKCNFARTETLVDLVIFAIEILKMTKHNGGYISTTREAYETARPYAGVHRARIDFCIFHHGFCRPHRHPGP